MLQLSDQNRPKPNQSLRIFSTRKPGGQPGHEGTTLTCNSQIDEVIKHSPVSCSGGGSELSQYKAILVSSRQLMDIPPIELKCIKHQVYKKQCNCGHTTQDSFPQHVANAVKYGPNVKVLISYLHARQYLPCGRMQELLNDVLGLQLCVGGIDIILTLLASKAIPVYNKMKECVEQATCIGAGETGVNINGKNIGYGPGKPKSSFTWYVQFGEATKPQKKPLAIACQRQFWYTPGGQAIL